MKTVSILESGRVAMQADVASISLAAEQAARQLGEPVEIHVLDYDALSSGDLMGTDVLVSPTGAYFREDKWGLLADYYRAGGFLLSLGCRPFSLPYAVHGGGTELLPETVAAIRSLKVVEQWVDTGATDGTMELRASGRYSALGDLFRAGDFPQMSRTASAHYNLTGAYIESASGWEAGARLETACGWYAGDGALRSAPIARIDAFGGGALALLNFTPAQERFYGTEQGIGLLAYFLKDALTDRLDASIEPVYARYREDETPELSLRVSALRAWGKGSYAASVAVESMDGGSAPRTLSFSFDIGSTGEAFQQIVSLDGLPCGFYRVVLRIRRGDALLDVAETGFYKTSDDAIRRELRSFRPIELDAGKAPDFCLRGGKPFAMHGTTYFVTDRYRKCFLHFNALRCREDLLQLKAAGFNTLRTGNWEAVTTFYDERGVIREGSARALEAFFLTAARLDLPVHFVFGSTVFNDWNREQCPIHNPEMRAIVRNVFRSFAARFAQWPNVMVDIINEPSYSAAGAWKPARPSGDLDEKEHWTQWLAGRYSGNIARLRQAWGVASSDIRSFEDAALPASGQFTRGYNRTEESVNHAALTDFFAFARESFSGWVRELRDIIKAAAPAMIVMMGRDESLRIPAEQDEVAAGTIQLVNWHQWQQNSIVFLEYVLNRVRGVPCCGQELGLYQAEDPLGFKRYSERELAKRLEKKLLYSFGNWVQWQSFSDPYMAQLCESTLGIYRADRTEMPGAKLAGLLAGIEEKMSPYMAGRDEDAVRILTVHPTSYYFSVDVDLAREGVRQHILALHYHLKQQADMVLEHLYAAGDERMTGHPRLIVLPATQMLSETAWRRLLDDARGGCTVLLCGDVNRDEYWRYRDRLSPLGVSFRIQPIHAQEKLQIGGETIDLSFRRVVGYCDPGHALNKIVFDGDERSAVRVIPCGLGRIICCPLPVELADSIEPSAALYRWALQSAGLENELFRMVDREPKPNLLLYAIPYAACTVYTLVNEGEADDIRFVDIASGASILMHADGNRGAKLWLGKDGNVLGAYFHDELRVNGQLYCGGDGTTLWREAGKLVEKRLRLG